MREVACRTKPTSTEDGKLVFTYNNAVVRKYSWGLDLSGWSGDASPSGTHNAGGIGGLLAAVETSGTRAGSYWYLYDANGNVGQVLNVTDPQSITLAAHYEYDAYGNPAVAPTGTYAAENPFRFSTKWRDDETGLYYYGYRYYDPRFGRWISRDPVEEAGGLNLYGHAINNPVDVIDPLGLTPVLCKLCAAAIVGKVGGSAAGCAIGCAESKWKVGSPYWKCMADCAAAVIDPCELWSQFKKNKAEWVGAAACVACGVQKFIEAQRPEPPPGCGDCSDWGNPEKSMNDDECAKLLQDALDALGRQDFKYYQELMIEWTAKCLDPGSGDPPNKAPGPPGRGIPQPVPAHCCNSR